MGAKMRFILVVVVVFGLAILACGSSEPEPAVVVTEPEEVEEPVQEEPEAAEEPEPTEEPEPELPPVGTSRDNPAPPGSEVTIEDYTFVVTEAIRPADDIVLSANMFNAEPEEGQEYVMVYLEATCNAEDSCMLTTMELSLIGSAGVVHDPEWMVADVDNTFEGGEFFSGATMGGYLFFIVPQDETGLMLRYEPLINLQDIQAFMLLPE